MSVELKGVNELRIALKKKADMAAMKRIVKMNGAELQQKAKRNAPVDTGTLKRSIVLELKDDGMTAECAATAEYAPYQEWGTRYMEAQPYMKPAFNAQKEKFKSDMDKLVR